jgi:hypothetical protein
LGFAGGNIAFKTCKRRLYLVIKQWYWSETDFLDSLVELMESDKKIGIASSKFYFYEDNTIQYAGASPINLLLLEEGTRI